MTGVMTNDPYDGLPPGLDGAGTPAQPRNSQTVERQTQTILTALVDKLIVVDNDERITDVNESLYDMTNFAEVELLGARAPFPFWPEERRDELTIAFNATLAGPPENLTVRAPATLSFWANSTGGSGS